MNHFPSLAVNIRLGTQGIKGRDKVGHSLVSRSKWLCA